MLKKRKVLSLSWKGLPKSKSSGFSLIELLIALGILATGLLMIIGMFPVGYKSIAQARERIYATHIARQQLEKVLSADYYMYGLSDTNTVNLNFSVNDQAHTTQFTYIITVSPDTYSGLSLVTNKLKTAVVMVYPTNRPERYVKMETAKAKEL